METEYPRIIFNGIKLPVGAIFIDYCASNNFFTNIDEDVSKWFWRFTNCVGLNCAEKSRTVIDYAERLSLMLVKNRDLVQEKIEERYGPDEAANVFDWWIQTLRIMIDSAKNREISNWTGLQE